ncbi:transcriptional regulator, IclR family [Geobacter metallireducens RCH3]|uniref:Helix-turn-helix transcriptional regulator, IclR family n=1 Tax=Geobacter metallireducens (strain ATCC 53774 / DSM 7210 / GS-15) TaxID=269799 RepID=Q39QH5_GEOMG|nr:IclR family transcriptional regulator [Geobacter metallireducens]ABB33499.1 helix-turn-helix transcriptional regulator, IclR family [Geobacter metallireducens GS-15]EHP87605.1 transcriptional regulator, IclR family [Geobacter metallireducens RCH3]
MKQDLSLHQTGSVEHVIALLETLTEDTPIHSVATISSRLGISRNKAFRLLATLESRELVEKDKHGSYRLGTAAADLARRLLDNVNIIGHARPVLNELARRHGEAVYLSVLKDDDVIFLDVADCAGVEGSGSLVGKRFPSLATSAGKAIRSLQSRDLLEKLLGGKRGRQRSVDLEAIIGELEVIRKHGVAIDEGGGTSSAATAVRDYTGKIVCALTVLGPSVRMLRDRIEKEIAPSLMEGAEVLSLRFGYAK